MATSTFKARVRITIKRKDAPKDFFSVFKKGLLLEAKNQTEKIANEIAREAKDIIRKQKYKWPPLSPDYLDHKIRKRLDPRILIATGDYLNHGIGKYKRGKNIYVGPLPGRHKGSKLTYRTLGRFLEFGTENMPARQLWRPLKSVVLARTKKLKIDYIKAMKKQVREQLSKSKVTKRKLSGSRT